jgi:small ligand-binding sensory domain FIST
VAPTAEAVAEACARAGADLGGTPDLALLFFTPDHAGGAHDLVEAVRQRLAPRCLLGCVAEGVIGNEREVEHGPALSLWLGRWGRPVSLDAFHLVLERTADGPSLFGWPDALALGAGEVAADPPAVPGPRAVRSAVLLLGDPFTFPTDRFLQRMNEDVRGVPVLGGMASGIRGPGQCRLLLGEQVLREGAVGRWAC